MNLKGTKSEANVRAAFAGESQARNKYTYYALQAQSEGHEDMAQLFQKMADNEREHAKIWFKILNDGLGDTGKNLQDAAMGENYEWKSMYPEFAAQAKADGLDVLANMFEKVAAIENDHERRFLEAFLKFKTQNNTKVVPEAVPALEKLKAQASEALEEKKSYRCMFCGDMETKALDVCPVCEAIGAYEFVNV